MAQKVQKANYKIYDTTTGKYVSSSRSKSTWLSMAWAVSAAEGMRYQNHLVIHEFPLNEPNVFTLEEARETIRRQKEMKQSTKDSAKVRTAYRALMKEIDEQEYELRMKRDRLEILKSQIR